MPLGTVVTVEGTVTTPAGVFDSSFFDVGFAIQDDAAGIFVSFPDPDQTVQPLQKAQPPRHVEVTGVLRRRRPAGDRPREHQGRARRQGQGRGTDWVHLVFAPARS